MKKIENMEKHKLNCNFFSVYDYDGLTQNELLCQFFTKINECITISNETIDLANWLVNEGLGEEVVKKLMVWLEDGTLADVINVELFTDLNNKIYSLQTEINVLYPPTKLTPCKMDGITDDTVALQTILNYAEELGRGVRVYIPNRKMVINSTVLIDFTKVNIKCDGEIITHMTEGVLFKEKSRTPENIWRVYEQGGIVVDGLKIVGSGIHSKTIGLLLETSNDNNIGSSRIKFENCSIKSFGTGVELGSRSYANTFSNTSIYDCSICVKIKSGFDCGERISFIGCTIFNSGVGFLIDNPNATVYIVNSSIDYCTERMIEVLSGNTFVNCSHIELDAKFYTPNDKAPFKVGKNACSTLTIDNSFIMLGRPDETTIASNIFDVDSNPYQGLSVTNCTLQGFKCSDRLVYNNGVARFINNNIKEWDAFTQVISDRNNLLVDSNCHNLDINYHSYIHLTNENLELQRGDNEWFGSNCWKVFKKTGPKTFGEIVLYAPYDGINKNILGQVEVISDVDNTVDIAFQGIRLGGDGKTFNFTDLTRVGQISLKGGVSKILTPNNRQSALESPNNNGGSFDYIAITIGMFNSPSSTIKFKNHYLHTL